MNQQDRKKVRAAQRRAEQIRKNRKRAQRKRAQRKRVRTHSSCRAFEDRGMKEALSMFSGPVQITFNARAREVWKGSMLKEMEQLGLAKQID